MEPITFVPGNTVTLFNTVHTVTGISDNHLVHLCTNDNVEKSLTITTLLGHHASGNLRAGPKCKRRKRAHEVTAHGRKVQFNAVNHSEKALKIGFHVREILSDLSNAGARIHDDDPEFQNTIKATAARLGLDHPPCARTVQRWKSSNLLVNRKDSSFVPRFHARGGKGISRVPAAVQDFMEEVVLNEYMTTDKISVAVCYQTLCANIAEANKLMPQVNRHKTPSLNTFRRWIDKRPAYDLYASRHGKAAADLKFRSSGRNTEQWGFMECVEVDHTWLDLMVVDEKEGLVLGRPRLTLFIEWTTRSCLGFTIGFEGTSTQTVLECLRVSVGAKDYVQTMYNQVRNPWPCWGICRYLKLDNGPEFHGLTFRQTMAELGIDLIYCPRKKPWFKARVERMIKRLNTDLMSTLPGASLTQVYNRLTGNDPSNYAVIDIHTLRHILHIWVVDIYQKTRHRGIKTSPDNAWKQNFDLTRVALPADSQLLDVLCTELVVRTVFHYGIEICGERTFNSPGLQEIKRRLQFDDYIKVKVRYRPAMLDKIWVYDDSEDAWLEVLNSSPATRDLSEFQLTMVHKVQREAESMGETIDVVEARRRIKALVEPLLRAKTQRARKKALKMLGWTTDTSVLTPKAREQDFSEDDIVLEPDLTKPAARKSSATKSAESGRAKTSRKGTSVPAASAGPIPTYATQNQASQVHKAEDVFEGDIPVFPTLGKGSPAALRGQA